MFDGDDAAAGGEPVEVPEWQTLISQLRSELETAKTELADLRATQGASPEVAALASEVASLSSRLTEALAGLETAKAELQQMRQSKSDADAADKPTPVPLTDASSVPMAPSAPSPPLTRAARKGWI